MALELVVTETFLSYEPGDRITDQAIVAGIRAGENARRVVVASDTIVLPPPTEPPPSPIAGLQAQLNMIMQRLAELEARPIGGGGTDPDPPPVQGDGDLVLDSQGRGVADAQGRYLVA